MPHSATAGLPARRTFSRCANTDAILGEEAGARAAAGELLDMAKELARQSQERAGLSIDDEGHIEYLAGVMLQEALARAMASP